MANNLTGDKAFAVGQHITTDDRSLMWGNFLLQSEDYLKKMHAFKFLAFFNKRIKNRFLFHANVFEREAVCRYVEKLIHMSPKANFNLCLNQTGIACYGYSDFDHQDADIFWHLQVIADDIVNKCMKIDDTKTDNLQRNWVEWSIRFEKDCIAIFFPTLKETTASQFRSEFLNSLYKT